MHTPKPWKSEYFPPGNEVQNGIAGYAIHAANGEGVAYNICRKENADLIEAAPELLEVLKCVEQWTEEIEEDSEIAGADMVEWFCGFYYKAMSVIKKAEGRTDG